MQSSSLAYVLHARPFKESHLIVDLFTENYGRISVMARNVKTQHPKSRIWQSFILLELSWRGQGDLPAVIEADALDYSVQLTGTPLFCGVYLNELLQKLLSKGEPCADLWQMYRQTLKQLNQPSLLEPCLRGFEFRLLQELGLGINFYQDSQGDVLEAEKNYQYHLGHGWLLKPGDAQGISGALISRLGAYVIDMLTATDWMDRVLTEDTVLWLSAKRLTRQALAGALSGQTLQSRQLFAMMAGA